MEALQGQEVKVDAEKAALKEQQTGEIIPLVPSSSLPLHTDSHASEAVDHSISNESRELIKQETHIEHVTKPITPATAKKERTKLVLATWQSDENVNECHSCKRSFNPLLLRFKVRSVCDSLVEAL